jgi:hypothetical protein
VRSAVSAQRKKTECAAVKIATAATSYLKTQNAPKTAIEALEGVTVPQHVSWKKGHGSDQETAGGGLC